MHDRGAVKAVRALPTPLVGEGKITTSAPPFPRLRHERVKDALMASSGLRDYCAEAFCCAGRSMSFCTRQFRISATYTSFSDGHASSWIQPNCLGCLPDLPSQPSTLPSRLSL